MTNNELATKKPYTQEQLDLIIRTVAKGATPDELKLFIMVAHRTGLDPFSKQIHFVKRRTKDGEVGVIQTGIDGFRAIADRSGKLAGIEDPIYDDENKDHPEKATVTVYKMVEGNKVAFTASARWKEYAQAYVKEGKQIYSPMWLKMPYLMLGKCAEALALRKAFSNDLSGIYAHEEMQQADNISVVDVQSSETIKPSEKQIEFIENLLLDKGYTKADLIDAGFNYDEITGGREGTASELISFLKKAPAKVIDEKPVVMQENEDLAKDIQF